MKSTLNEWIKEFLPESILMKRIQGKPENRKLPYSRMSICNTIHTGRMGSFLFSGTFEGVFNPFIHYCNHVVTKFNARVIYTYGI